MTAKAVRQWRLGVAWVYLWHYLGYVQTWWFRAIGCIGFALLFFYWSRDLVNNNVPAAYYLVDALALGHLGALGLFFGVAGCVAIGILCAIRFFVNILGQLVLNLCYLYMDLVLGHWVGISLGALAQFPDLYSFVGFSIAVVVTCIYCWVPISLRH